MDRFKFRGQRIDNGEWVYGDFLNVLPGSDAQICNNGYCVLGEFTQAFAQAVDPATVGQFTGLKDAVGREIYEGDIVTNYQGDIQEVVYDKTGRWHCRLHKKATDFWPAQYLDCYHMQWKVIGNIYENPELLK